MALKSIPAILAIALFSASCTKTSSKIDDGFSAGVELSKSNTFITQSAAGVFAGGSLTLTLSVRDQHGEAYYIPNSSRVVVFSILSGTSTGTFSSVTDLNNGNYSVVFTGANSGTPITVGATIDGMKLDATALLQVAPGNLSVANSYVTLSSASIVRGSTLTATLHTYDTSNNPLTAGGLLVAFSNTTTGTSAGTFSAVTDLGNGTYTAIFTGTANGTTTGITATAGGVALTHAAPSVIVTLPAPSAFTISGVTAQLGSVKVDWNASTDVASYDILYDTASHASSGSYASSVLGATSGAAVTLTAGTVYYFRVRANNATGSVLSTNELSTGSLQSFSLNIPYTASTESSYTFNPTATPARVEFAGGVSRLKAADQSDSSTTTAPTTGGFMSGTHLGTTWDSSANYVRLNTTDNKSSLDASWAPQWSALVAYWKFDEAVGSTTFTDTVPGNAYPGTITSPGSITATGRLGNAIAFTGATNGKAQTALGPVMTTQATVMAWVKFNAYPTTYCRFVAQGIGSGYETFNLQYSLTASGGIGGQFYFSDGTNRTTPSSTAVILGTWYHVVSTYDGNLAHIYINGVEMGSGLAAVGKTLRTANPNTAVSFGISSTEFPNIVLDDVAVWNVALNASEIGVIYSRLGDKYSGSFTSRVFDAYSAQSWTSLTPTTNQPFNASITGTSLKTNLVGLWHLDEPAGTTGANIIDSSGVATPSNGTPTASGVILGGPSRFNTGAQFAGGGGISIPSTTGLAISGSKVSLSSWIFPTSGASSIIVGKAFAATHTSPWFDYMLFLFTNNTVGFRIGATNITTTARCEYNTWCHVAGVYDGVTMKVYLNGVEAASTPLTGNVHAGTNPLLIGQNIGNAERFSGVIDDVGVWSRDLSATEISEMYRRGANRLRYQVRGCANNDCSDQELLTTSGKGWKGSGGSQLSYFSELAPATAFSVTSKQYFQYRAILDSDVQTSLCTYASASAPCSPELQSIAVGPTHYDTTVQSVTSKTSIGSTYKTLDANGFTETLGAGACSAGAKYSISSNGTTFYAWDGTTWSASTDDTTANSAATIRAHIATFPASSAGTLQLKTYLKSDGTSACEVDNVLITGQKF